MQYIQNYHTAEDKISKMLKQNRINNSLF